MRCYLCTKCKHNCSKGGDNKRYCKQTATDDKNQVSICTNGDFQSYWHVVSKCRCVCVCLSCLWEMKTSRRRPLGITNYLVKRSLVHWCVGAVNATICTGQPHGCRIPQLPSDADAQTFKQRRWWRTHQCQCEIMWNQIVPGHDMSYTGCLYSGTKDQPGRLMPMICCLPTSIVKALDPDTPFHDTGSVVKIGWCGSFVISEHFGIPSLLRFKSRPSIRKLPTENASCWNWLHSLHPQVS